MKCQPDGKLPLNENRQTVAMVPPLPLSSEEFSFAATEEDMEKSILNAEKENYT